MKFVNWDRRPALLFSDERPEMALAVVKPGGAWKEVDFLDVYATAGLMTEETWRARFEPIYGPLDVGAAKALQASPAALDAAE